MQRKKTRRFAGCSIVIGGINMNSWLEKERRREIDVGARYVLYVCVCVFLVVC